MEKQKNKLLQANFWKHPFPTNAYDHILMPEAFFPLLVGISTPTPLITLIDHLSPALKKGGTLRISCVNYNLGVGWPEQREHLLKRFEVSLTRQGVILTKK